LRHNVVDFFVGSEEAFRETRIGALKDLREKRPEWLRE